MPPDLITLINGMTCSYLSIQNITLFQKAATVRMRKNEKQDRGAQRISMNMGTVKHGRDSKRELSAMNNHLEVGSRNNIHTKSFPENMDMPAPDFDPTNPGSHPVPRMSQYAYRENLDGIGIKSASGATVHAMTTTPGKLPYED